MRISKCKRINYGVVLEISELNPIEVDLVSYEEGERERLDTINIRTIKANPNELNHLVNRCIGSEREWYMSKEVYELIHEKK